MVDCISLSLDLLMSYGKLFSKARQQYVLGLDVWRVIQTLKKHNLALRCVENLRSQWIHL